MKELATAMAKAQAEVKAALKDAENPAFKQGGRVSKYADLTSVWDACRAALTKHGLSVIQRTDFDGADMWLETMLLHASGEHISGRYPLRPQQATPQGYGSAMTYARRYALAAMVGVVVDEDDDGNAASAPRHETIRAVEPTQSTMVGRKNEAEGVRKAREWVNAEALPAVKACKTAEELNVWCEANAKIRERVKVVVPEDAAALEHRIGLKAESFNTLAAG